MKAVKSFVAALAVAAVITPAQADDRAVFGAVIAGVITYHVLKQHDEPRVVYQQPVYQQPQVIIVQPCASLTAICVRPTLRLVRVPFMCRNAGIKRLTVWYFGCIINT